MHKLNTRGRINKPFHQPERCKPVYIGIGTGYPDFLSVALGICQRNNGLWRSRGLLRFSQHFLQGSALATGEKIDGTYDFQPLFKLAQRCKPILRIRLCHHSSNFFGQRTVVFVARLGEGSSNLRICNIQQIAVGNDQRFTALLVCFLAHPDKLLL